MDSRSVAAIIFYNNDKEILLQERGDYAKNGEDWSFFGGGIEAGETPEEGFFREAQEELGLDMTKFPYRYLGQKIRYYPDKDFLTVRHLYAIQTNLEETDFTVYEGIGCRYFDFATAKTLRFPNPVEDVLEFLEEVL